MVQINPWRLMNCEDAAAWHEELIELRREPEDDKLHYFLEEEREIRFEPLARNSDGEVLKVRDPIVLPIGTEVKVFGAIRNARMPGYLLQTDICYYLPDGSTVKVRSITGSKRKGGDAPRDREVVVTRPPVASNRSSCSDPIGAHPRSRI